MHTDEVERILARTGALLRGHFELRSGLHSDRYFQCAKVLMYPDIAERLCRALAEKMRAAFDGGLAPDAVIAPALGGLIVGHELARALGTPFIFAEKNRDGRLEVRRDFRMEPGQRLVVAEDVITRGGRVQETIDLVLAAGASVDAIGVVVDRSAGQARFACPVFSLLEMAPETHEPASCPLCRAGGRAVHPGS